MTADKSKERRERLSNVDPATLRELMTDAAFTTDSRVPMKKPAFFFGDNISEGGYTLHDGDYKWFRQIEGRRFFLLMCDEGSEDVVASDSDYRLRSCRKIDSFTS